MPPSWQPNTFPLPHNNNPSWILPPKIKPTNDSSKRHPLNPTTPPHTNHIKTRSSPVPLSIDKIFTHCSLCVRPLVYPIFSPPGMSLRARSSCMNWVSCCRLFLISSCHCSRSSIESPLPARTQDSHGHAWLHIQSPLPARTWDSHTWLLRVSVACEDTRQSYMIIYSLHCLRGHETVTHGYSESPLPARTRDSHTWLSIVSIACEDTRQSHMATKSLHCLGGHKTVTVMHGYIHSLHCLGGQETVTHGYSESPLPVRTQDSHGHAWLHIQSPLPARTRDSHTWLHSLHCLQGHKTVTHGYTVYIAWEDMRWSHMATHTVSIASEDTKQSCMATYSFHDTIMHGYTYSFHCLRGHETVTHSYTFSLQCEF